MLVLTRQVDERILINPGTPDEIVILLVETLPGKARIGIAAPKHVVIHREEVWEAIKQERKGA